MKTVREQLKDLEPKLTKIYSDLKADLSKEQATASNRKVRVVLAHLFDLLRSIDSL